MFKEKFEIITIDDHKAVIKPLRQTTCDGCQMNTSCGVGLLSGYFNKTLKTTVNAQQQPGDIITLTLSEHTVIKHAFLLYIMPLLVMIVTVLVIQWLGFGEVVSLMVGIGAFGLSLWGLKRAYRV